LRCSFLGRTHQPVLHYSGSQECTNQSQQPLVADPFGNLREQSVVVDPVVDARYWVAGKKTSDGVMNSSLGSSVATRTRSNLPFFPPGPALKVNRY
jgi:hypothetical protein